MPETVIVHVYDLSQEINDKYYKYGFGLFHSGVEVAGKEYWFFGHEFPFTGILEFPVGLRTAAGMTKRQSVSLGTTNLPPNEIKKIVDNLSLKYTGQSYHPVKNNCNNFSEELCRKLLGKGLPGFVNRLAYIGSWVLYVFPEKWIWWIVNKFLGAEAPPNDTNNSENCNGHSHSHSHSHDDEEAAHLHEIEVESESPERTQWIEYMKAVAKEPAEKQRVLSTQIFMALHNGTITFDSIIPHQ